MDTAFVINSITKHNESNGIRCNPIFAEYQTGISGIQNIATVRMTFLDSWNMLFIPVMLFIALNLLYILQKLKVFIW